MASSPSGDDFAQMVEINHAKEYDCKEPPLLILVIALLNEAAKPEKLSG